MRMSLDLRGPVNLTMDIIRVVRLIRRLLLLLLLGIVILRVSSRWQSWRFQRGVALLWRVTGGLW